MTITRPPAWIPTPLLRQDDLVNFPPGTLVLEPAPVEGGAVLLFLRVTLGDKAGLMQLTPGPEAPTGCIFDIDEDETGFGVVTGPSIALEWDLGGATSPPGFTLAEVGQVALGKGGVRLVVTRRKARGASYLDPTDWALRPFKDGQEPRIISAAWRLVLPLTPDRPAVVFDVPSAGTAGKGPVKLP
ncbi:hypothetical protein [Phenylobacterium kunshanense]|uniref:Uncharacterized protein n=1 Tax=Phenylobacterium kunshanense TaxID=1445034 RepID=A0A328BGX3_9CAUL|nr:hypothetical protein [Phenylobacterium kunshanense]RAK66363.1 hypothetical protein DJ019_08945 [Phenylobacterium kunshanense]